MTQLLLVPLVFYNSLTKKLEPFVPQQPGHVRMYHCGPTVYKRQHIGNMRRFLFADFLRRSLEYAGYTVEEVTNITDVGHLTQDDIDAGEDKLQQEARTQHVTPQTIADREIQTFFADIDALNIQRSHHYPRATQHIEQMQTMIATLLQKGHAYQTATGVYFDVPSFPAYGKLSGNTLEQLQAGKRVTVRGDKRHPADFALWVVDTAALQRWPSPWGEGYPGWHIECSAMSGQYLGNDFDIHTGGEDNRFPHHENEIAQTEAATGRPLAKYWMHNRFLNLAGAKLAKREGKQITLDTIRKQGYSPLAFRLLIFASHYRQSLEFSWDNLGSAHENVQTIANLLRRLWEFGAPVTGEHVDEAVTSPFGEALAQDLGTPRALALLLEYVRTIHRRLDRDTALPPEELQLIWATLHRLDRVVGIMASLERDLDTQQIPAEITALTQQRELARREGNFNEADRLRQKVQKQGYVIEDTEQGPRVRKKPA